MLKVKNGDPDKLGLLFERYHRILFVFFYRMNFDQQLSEDLVQTVFMRILKYKHAFKGSGEFKTWMFHIARNVNNDHFKKEKKLGYKEVADSYRNKLTDHEDIKTREDINHNIDLLKKALTYLDKEKREVITLSKLEGMKYKEIGELLDCTEGAVKVKVFRALNDLKSVFEKIKLTHG